MQRSVVDCRFCMTLPAAQAHINGGVDGCTPKEGGWQCDLLDVSTPGQRPHADCLQDILGVGSSSIRALAEAPCAAILKDTLHFSPEFSSFRRQGAGTAEQR
jgi:hypothetical protein